MMLEGQQENGANVMDNGEADKHGQREQIISMLITGHPCSHIPKCLAWWSTARESCSEVLHQVGLHSLLKNLLYIFSPHHLYMKETVVLRGQFNRMKTLHWHEGGARKIGNLYFISTEPIMGFLSTDQERSQKDL